MVNELTSKRCGSSFVLGLLLTHSLLITEACSRRVPLTSRQLESAEASRTADIATQPRGVPPRATAEAAHDDVSAPAQTNQSEPQSNEVVCSDEKTRDAPAADIGAVLSPNPSATATEAPIGRGANRAGLKPCHLLAVGDSLTDPKSGGGGYLEAVRKDCGCQITNIGQGGAMVNQIRARLLTHLADVPSAYSHVVVFGGVNDLYSDLTAKRTVEKITADLKAIYRAAQQRGSMVIAISVTPWGGFKRYFTDHRWQNTLTLNRWIRESTSRGLANAVLDGERLLACGSAQELCEQYASPYRDGLHFGPLGHRRLGRALVRALGPNYCRSMPDDGPDQGALDGQNRSIVVPDAKNHPASP